MNNFWVPMALSIVFEVLKQSVKNPESKAKMRSAFLKLFIAIKTLYADDAEFN